MSNGHSAEGIEATCPEDDDWAQQKYLEEEQMQAEESGNMKKVKSLSDKAAKQRWRDLKGPETRKEFLTKLVTDHGLVTSEDIFSKENKWAIIKLTGIEKIQNNLNIRVKFESVVIERDFSVIKAIAIGSNEVVESYGSASKGKHPDGNVSHSYVVEMAEKRAKNRAVLKLCGAYKYGVYSEDESEDFRQD
jgi:hypothetical protein|tara:strand:- start:544 stop:1116 length:573 start_codon:yes stop_codon:yes gene_type:complete